MVRWASGVTTMRLRPVGGPSVARALTKVTPMAVRSWANTWPSWSSATRPMYPARPPKLATPTVLLATEPPDISMPGPIAAYSSSARSVSTSVIALLTRPWAATNSSVSCDSTSTSALPMPTTSRLASAVIRARLLGPAATRRKPQRRVDTVHVRVAIREPAPAAPHRRPPPLRPDAGTRPRRRHLRRRGDRGGRGGRTDGRGGAQRRRARDRRGHRRGRRGRRPAGRRRGPRRRGRAGHPHLRPPAPGRRGPTPPAVPGRAQRQARGLLPLDLHRRVGGRAGAGHHPDGGHRRPPGVPVLGRARRQGRVRRHAGGARRPAGAVQRRRA